MERNLWKRKRAVLCALAVIAVLAATLSYRDIFQVLGAFAPHNYQNILVLDAGHGGMDGGAVAEDGTMEQEINLSIAQKCRDYAGLFGLRTLLTRQDSGSIDYDPEKSIRENKIADIHGRVRITNGVPNPIFLSIHLNKFSDSSYSGAQVFWSKNNPEGELLAQQLQAALTRGLRPARERQAKRAEDSIYLMKTLLCPAVIVECGFLSNAAEARRLAQDGYQKALALCIVGGYLQYAEQS